ncbi:carbohydrate kinase family protein [Microbacterium azadirachtae]|uniref:carbohydrate kinase family protein n=1 Tax=Microbacterium azadirachtae TaxID=582680 RepID=UPI003F755D5A
MTAGAERILVIGEALIDIVDRGGRLARHVGGSPLNVAFGLARLGLTTTFATAFGTDEGGSAIVRHLAEAGVSIVRTADAGRPTSTALARIGADGSASYEFDLTWAFSTPPATAGFDVVHVGSIGALRAPGADGVRELVAGLPEQVLVTFDPNIRAALMPPREATRTRVEAYAARAAVVKLSDEDAAWLYPDDAQAAPERLLAAGARLVVMTRGAEGSVLHTGELRVEVPVRPTVAVDTIGAGDAYMSGLIAAIVRRVGIDDARAGRFTREQLAEIGAVAAASAALTVGRAGAMPPTAAELDRALDRALAGEAPTPAAVQGSVVPLR